MSTADPSEPVGLAVGRVGRPHGLDGSFYLTRPKPRLLSLDTPLLLAGRPVTLVRLAGTAQRPILRIAGVDDREGAEALRGAELTLDRRDAPALADGEWWSHELEGCTVRDGEYVLGEVTRMIELPSCEALEVAPARGGAPILIPMVKDAIRRVEPAGRSIEVNLEFLDLAARGGGARGAEGETPPADGPGG